MFSSILVGMASPVVQQVLQLLITKGVVSGEAAAQLQQQNIADPAQLRDQLLASDDTVTEEQFTQVWAEAVGLSYVNLAEIQIPKEVLTILPESTARGHMIITYQQTEEGLFVAMADPSDRQMVEFIHKKVDLPVTVSLASPNSIRHALNQYQESLAVEFEELAREAANVSTDDESKAAEELPTIRIVDAMLKHAILQDASDIHVEPTETQVIIRYRIDGILHDVLTLNKNVLAGIVARIKVLSNLKIDEHRLPQDGRFKIESDDYKVAFRVSTLPVFDGEKIVMRLLDESGHGLGLDDIGMSERALKIFRNNISKPHGMILVTGPTGSGKTTTLYAAMKELNTQDVNISTIEDPIEYRMGRINQTQVQPKVGLTFANGLRALVRQDPDIIMVGEIRDEETAALAVNAALTGHLVLSTLHTNSAAGALPRLLDMSVEAFLVATTTNLLCAQRLVRRLCEDCKQEVTMDKTMIESLTALTESEALMATLAREGVVKEGTTLESLKLYQPGEGCAKCREGYKGRVGIYELLEVSPAIQQKIKGNTSAQELEAAAKEDQNMVTMLEDGMIKAIEGKTSVEEVLRVAKE